MRSRTERLRRIEGSSFDICVIGGATGASCALDAQLRGLRTVLVEAGDFASDLEQVHREAARLDGRAYTSRDRVVRRHDQ